MLTTETSFSRTQRQRPCTLTPLFGHTALPTSRCGHRGQTSMLALTVCKQCGHRLNARGTSSDVDGNRATKRNPINGVQITEMIFQRLALWPFFSANRPTSAASRAQMNIMDITIMNERILHRPRRVCFRPCTCSHPSMFLQTLQFFHDSCHHIM